MQAPGYAIESALRDAYGFHEVAVGERLEGGYANDLFRVVSDGEPFVLRIKHPPWRRADGSRCRSYTATSSRATCRSSQTPSSERRFIDGYRSAGGIAPPRDDELLVPLVRVKRILEVLRAPTDRHPRWEHQRRNLRSLQNLEDSLCDGLVAASP
jgi:hypothetical protein